MTLNLGLGLRCIRHRPFTPLGLVELALEDGEEAADPVVQSDVHDELEDVDDLQLRVHDQVVLLGSSYRFAYYDNVQFKPLLGTVRHMSSKFLIAHQHLMINEAKLCLGVNYSRDCRS